MTAAVHTPITTDLAENLGKRRWRKQVLPIGSIDYKGRRLDFTKDYLASLAKSFTDGAYDSVKFLLAPGDNSHTLDPERARGTVTGFELTNDGLDMLLDATDAGSKVLKENPDLGVSVRIVEDLQRADGKAFPRAIQHVLGTLDPRVTGMRPWEAVSLSNDDQAVDLLDLTAADFAEKEKKMPEITEAQQALLDKLAAVPEDRLNAILAEPTEPTEDELARIVADAEAAAAADADKEPVGAALSVEAQAAIDLANSRAEQAETSARDSARRVARAEWTAERQILLSQGVDPAALDLAAPWCGGDIPTGFIDLANDATPTKTVTAAAADTIRKFLELRKGTVDLSVRGENVEQSDDPREDPAYKQWLAENPITH